MANNDLHDGEINTDDEATVSSPGRLSFVIPQWLLLSFLCVFAGAFLSVGCENSRSDLSVSKQPKDTAQADFDWAMQRLRRVLETFTPPANLRLRIKRDLSYEFYPPDTSQPNYTAQVTIKSKTFYKPEQYAPAEDKDTARTIAAGPQADESAFAEEMVANRANDPSSLFDADGAFPSKKPLIAEPRMPTPRLDKQSVYDLIYRDRRWQLETQPESEHEQMWFEYALQP